INQLLRHSALANLRAPRETLFSTKQTRLLHLAAEVPAMKQRPTDRILLAGCATLAFHILLVGGGAALPDAAATPQAQAKGGPEAEWKVGLAEIKITPEMPVAMSGYASRTKPFEKVATDLYAK